MKETVRYCFIRGLVHNSVSAIRDTIFKVCVAIESGDDFVNEYRKNLLSEDIEKFRQKIENDSSYGRYTRGLVLLNSFLNSRQDIPRYGDFIKKKIHIEHILPQDWNNYDCWNEESHRLNINKLGNLMPLEANINIKASNEFFSRKMKKYGNSQVQDASDLSVKKPARWYPCDFEKRHCESLCRLYTFFEI